MSNSGFFDESREHSLVKAEIVAKYFWSWTRVIIPHAKKMRQKKIAYVDLFSGPGRYKDGSKSTPLLILERAIREADTREMLVTIFNDINSNYTQSLQQAINSLPDIDTLSNRPVVLNKEVGEEIVQALEQIRSVPTLFFIDPCGYKGLSLKLIGDVIKGWGCDCIFFFNYNRINMGLNNPAVEKHMNSLFGKERADTLREQLKPMQPEEREATIVEGIFQALKEVGGARVQDFCFKNASGGRTSHYLFFVCKHSRGHTIMKEIMAKKSSIFAQGVPSFEYNPVPIQLSLFDLNLLDNLEIMLLDELAGRTMTVLEVYERHHVGKRYIKKNYKEALLKLEAQGKITAEPPASQRPKRQGKITFADNVRVTFQPLQ